MSAVITDSYRIMRFCWRRLSPIARSMPSSRVRSWIDSDSVLAMPNSDTMMASASRP